MWGHFLHVNQTWGSGIATVSNENDALDSQYVTVAEYEKDANRSYEDGGSGLLTWEYPASEVQFITNASSSYILQLKFCSILSV